MEDEKQANESLKEELYNKFLQGIDMAKLQIKVARDYGLDTLADEMEKELQGISK